MRCLHCNGKQGTQRPEGCQRRDEASDLSLIHILTVAEAKKYMEQGQFGEGDMQPKIQAAIDFIGDSAIRSVLITKLHVDGSQVTPGMGTMITK